MKKVLCLILCSLFLGVSAFAVSTDDYSVYTKDNTTGYYATTNVSTSTIIPGVHSIIGYTVMSLTGHVVNGTLISGGSENVASIWDEVSGTSSPSMIGPEIESIDESFDGYMCLRPKPITNGITIRQGANTRVQILYEHSH